MEDLFAAIDAAQVSARHRLEVKGLVKQVHSVVPRRRLGGKAWGAVRRVGSEFSRPSILPITDFKSEWDRERCKSPSRTYPRSGTVSTFYNPIGKAWIPNGLCDSVLCV